MLQDLNQYAQSYEYLLKAIATFLPFLIAIFMAYIAYQQWQTNERKRKQDLFDKRWAFYKKMRELFEKLQDDKEVVATFEITDLFLYGTSADEAKFLFGTDIQNHILNIEALANSRNYDNFQNLLKSIFVYKRHK